MHGAPYGNTSCEVFKERTQIFHSKNVSRYQERNFGGQKWFSTYLCFRYLFSVGKLFCRCWSYMLINIYEEFRVRIFLLILFLGKTLLQKSFICDHFLGFFFVILHPFPEFFITIIYYHGAPTPPAKLPHRK